MPSVPAAVLLLVLSAASWPTTLQQAAKTTARAEHPRGPIDTPDLSTTITAASNDTVPTTATELLSTALVTLLSLCSSLLHSLPATVDSLYERLSSLSLAPITALFTATSSASAPHDHTIAVLLFLVVALSVLLVLLSCLTLGAWQRYAAPIAAFRVEWHSTRARRREKKADKREKDSTDGRQNGSGDSEHKTGSVAAAAAGADGSSSSSSRQTSEHLYGFISRARALSEAEDDMEMTTPTVVVPGRDPFSQLKRTKY